MSKYIFVTYLKKTSLSNEFTKKTVEIEPKRSDIDFNRKIIRIKMTFIVQKTQETGTVERGTVYVLIRGREQYNDNRTKLDGERV